MRENIKKIAIKFENIIIQQLTIYRIWLDKWEWEHLQQHEKKNFIRISAKFATGCKIFYIVYDFVQHVAVAYTLSANFHCNKWKGKTIPSSSMTFAEIVFLKKMLTTYLTMDWESRFNAFGVFCGIDCE